MSFPYHDRFWCETADFLEGKVGRTDAILAPDIFWWRFRKIYRYLNTRLRPEHKYDWVVLHKGMIEELPAKFVIGAFDSLKPAFANDVFVVLARDTDAPVAADNPHLASLTGRLPDLTAESERPVPAAETQPVLPEPGAIYKFTALEPEGFGEAMDEFWEHGGYIYSTLRDKTYYGEIDRYIKEFVGDGAGQTILDLACGIGRLGDLMSPTAKIMGVDVSGVAIEMGKRRHADKPNFTFEVMDAHKVAYPDRSFDIVLFIDAIEHVLDVETVFAEMSRLVKPGGLMMATIANRDSVNQILTTKLGNPEFLTNYQHIREFSYAESLDLLKRHGFTLERSAGIFLYPYWGVPGVDEVVRKITDEDPEFVELMRILGERAGAEYAYCSVVLGRKVM